MRTIKCVDVSHDEECDFEVTAVSDKEAIDKYLAHAHAAHPDVANDLQKNLILVHKR